MSDSIIFTFPRELANGNSLVLLGLFFPIVGLILVIWAVKVTIALFRFGDALLTLDPFPGEIGGDVGGTIRVRRNLPSDSKAEVLLSCIHIYSDRSQNQKSITKEVIRWQDRQVVSVESDSNDSVIRFCFTVPNKLPSTEEQSLPYHKWTVDVNCKLSGIDFYRNYVIPVFVRGESRTSTVRDV